MMMRVNIGDKPPADFAQPIEMLKDCHRRIEHFLNVLQAVLDQYGEGELGDEGRRALKASLSYFLNFAPRHIADEEQSLFPRLRASENEEARAVFAELDLLERDHRRGEARHQVVEDLAGQWLTAGRIDERTRSRLAAAVSELAAMYAEHIRLEEQRVFVLAASALNAEQLHDMGEEMKRRRSLAD
jgi:hemerythrin-like domain-containing protein